MDATRKGTDPETKLLNQKGAHEMRRCTSNPRDHGIAQQITMTLKQAGALVRVGTFRPPPPPRQLCATE